MTPLNPEDALFVAVVAGCGALGALTRIAGLLLPDKLIGDDWLLMSEAVAIASCIGVALSLLTVAGDATAIIGLATAALLISAGGSNDDFHC